MNEYKQKLKESMELFLAPFEHYGHITNAIKNLEDVFFGITGLDPFSRPQNFDSETHLEQGVAIAPNFAGMCVREFMRTWYYLKGMFLGIKSTIAAFPGQRIRVLYAGCGPFAALFIPLTSCFTSKEVGFTLLDIHPQSIQSVKKLIDALDISSYVDDCQVTDVLRFNPSPGNRYHLVVTETMNQALRKEPQVAITHYLSPYLLPQGIFIPHRVTISAAVTDYDHQYPESHSTNPGRPKINLGIIFELFPGLQDYPAVTFQIPHLINKNNLLVLLTEITVFDHLVLTEGQCSLTLPYRYCFLHQLPPADQYIASYEISSLPGIRIKTGPAARGTYY